MLLFHKLIHSKYYIKGAEYFGETSERYVGEYVNDLREGQGSAYNPDGTLKFTGSWKAGRPHGIGTAYYNFFDSKKKSFVSQRLHGSFQNGVYIGLSQDRSTRKLLGSLTKNYMSDTNLFENARIIGNSFYRNLYTFVERAFQTIHRFLGF